MSLVSPNMVNVRIAKNAVFTLEDYLSGKNSTPVPVQAFGSTVSKSLINKAVNHLKSVGGGEVSVPVPDGYTYSVLPNFIISVVSDGSGGFFTRYQVYSWREPIGKEERPYGGDWVVGDVVYNYAASRSTYPCIGWICSRSGSSGMWEQIGSGNIMNSTGSGNIVGPSADKGILTISTVDGKLTIDIT